ncbi:MAG: hypothetical protein Hyperionvirus42_8 [Hyperionvirus sp.]|uniref:Uncharacterized protein n=1 Tax=Hyperionvirus sp. TaxID=2487770 RepID=A0A3G5ACF3_9VIRU|nr:MAG: hypothetical protein Hyperionvirus42_8 [Hyperionvirus sp.]
MEIEKLLIRKIKSVYCIFRKVQELTLARPLRIRTKYVDLELMHLYILN